MSVARLTVRTGPSGGMRSRRSSHEWHESRVPIKITCLLVPYISCLLLCVLWVSCSNMIVDELSLPETKRKP
jgi:hypothetical protein